MKRPLNPSEPSSNRTDISSIPPSIYLKNRRMPIRVSLPCCCSCMPVWLSILLERCLTIEHVGEHIGNQRKMKRNPPPWPLLPKFKRNKSKAPWVHAWAFHWLHEISIPKRVCHHLELEWEMRRTGWGGSTG
jgi:hypothetical protein